MTMGSLGRTADGWRIHAIALTRFARERAAEERAQADKFLAVDKADQRPTDQVALPEDKHSIYSVVRALVKATEARNPYARGHTDSTTRYAMAIAQFSLRIEPYLMEAWTRKFAGDDEETFVSLRERWQQAVGRNWALPHTQRALIIQPQRKPRQQSAAYAFDESPVNDHDVPF